MIQTESTPNPNSLKFLSERVISAVGTEEFQKGKSKETTSPFIKELLEFKGVEIEFTYNLILKLNNSPIHSGQYFFVYES